MIFFLKNWKLILGATLLTGVALFVWHYKHTLEENKRLTDEIRAGNSTIETLEEKAKSEREVNETVRTIVKEVRREPENVVVNNTIDRIDELRYRAITSEP